MGQIYKVSCKCGYEKRLSLGGGLSSINIRRIRMMFSEEKLKEFNKAIKEDKMKRFFMTSEAAFCDKCKEIIQIARLNYELKNGEKFEIVNECPTCGSKVKILNKEYKCPVCNNSIKIEAEGFWD